MQAGALPRDWYWAENDENTAGWINSTKRLAKFWRHNSHSKQKKAAVTATKSQIASSLVTSDKTLKPTEPDKQ